MIVQIGPKGVAPPAGIEEGLDAWTEVAAFMKTMESD
jgi:hypothetical protein